jgi:hypothetical protein
LTIAPQIAGPIPIETNGREAAVNAPGHAGLRARPIPRDSRRLPMRSLVLNLLLYGSMALALVNMARIYSWVPGLIADLVRGAFTRRTGGD